ncbi:hypothetical protein RFI_08642 [Reticulomyxa filosa]|uniref:Uncharacterized protein n=1 Tax=Reticulomyxa filosa TaxID=46433 RepID=X6NT58_RETFI|nr:hypothetical protein RFI_08642 [Reticulomyxa filosa]|eukprot:ETO28492.1 hypothetical protein RFI_08642 [Reticulomyxa filosa]
MNQLYSFNDFVAKGGNANVSQLSPVLDKALVEVIIPHPKSSYAALRDVIAQICVHYYRIQSSSLEKFFKQMIVLANSKTPHVKLYGMICQANTQILSSVHICYKYMCITSLHIMGELCGSFPRLMTYLTDVCNVLLKSTARKMPLSLRLVSVNVLEKCIKGAEKGIRGNTTELMKVFEQLAKVI